MTNMVPVVPPLFISSRLMAALKIEGVGTVHVGDTRRSREGRVAYRCVIEDADGKELFDGPGIHSGVGDRVDYTRAIATTLHFLHSDGETYRRTMGAPSTNEDDEPCFNAAVSEWAYMNSDELVMTAYELDEDA